MTSPAAVSNTGLTHGVRPPGQPPRFRPAHADGRAGPPSSTPYHGGPALTHAAAPRPPHPPRGAAVRDDETNGELLAMLMLAIAAVAGGLALGVVTAGRLGPVIDGLSDGVGDSTAALVLRAAAAGGVMLVPRAVLARYDHRRHHKRRRR